MPDGARLCLPVLDGARLCPPVLDGARLCPPVPDGARCAGLCQPCPAALPAPSSSLLAPPGALH
ncbi:hypothetical protein HMPREF1978_00430 [Actinomyces graevenitzii F0530]|uniref:Uncharacterized protein n=1 Tax=Actinomyces graevenitzii F0530 TaxID=1321817 RepID=U1PN34_9ACTO|nr:hypothetical protein HMPREF1978_00430 [Actinomyces graevenitzii F0530]